MSRFRIEGQQTLKGDISVQGSKNAATKILAATLLCHGTTIIRNVPRIEDVLRIVELLESMGVRIVWSGEHEVTVTAADVHPERLHHATVRRLRASAVLLGALTGRFGQVTLPGPGGDNIGARPLDPHFEVFRCLGITVEHKGELLVLRQTDRRNVTCTMSEFSVTATENAVLASVLLPGKLTTITCAAADPSVQDLCWFLNTLGARIAGVGSHRLMIEGVAKLEPNRTYSVMPDPVESGTFIILGAAARAHIRIRGIAPDFLHAEFQKLREANVNFEVLDWRPSTNERYRIADVEVRHHTQLRAVRNLHNMPYPGFSPDLLQPCAVMLTQSNGTSLVHDWMYEGRLKYVEELNKMGAQIFVADPHRILVSGPSNLYGADITNYDIRTGAALFIAALIAAGTSTIAPTYQLDRGYEALDERLRSLGAHVERLKG